MNQDDAQRSNRILATIVTALLAGIALLFLPLGLAFVEEILGRTEYVEDFCRYIGIYQFLDAIYDPVLNVFQ
jgi:hypothetical protein